MFNCAHDRSANTSWRLRRWIHRSSARRGASAVAFMSGLALCASTAAAPLELYFEGTVQFGSSQNVNLQGKAVSGRFVFDPAQAPPDSFTSVNDPSLLSEYRGDFLRTSVTDYQWISSEFTIEGTAYASAREVPPSGNEGVQVLDFISIACECYDQYIIFDSDSGSGFSHGMSFNFVRFLDGPGNFLDGGQQIDQTFRIDDWGPNDWRTGSVSHCAEDDNGQLRCTFANIRLERIQAAPLGVRAVEELQSAFAGTPGLSEQSLLVGTFAESGNTKAACAILNAMEKRVSSLPDQQQLDLVQAAREDLGCTVD